MVTGLLERDSGEVFVNGLPLTTTSIDAKREIGLVPQDLAIYPDLTARENLIFFGKLYEMSGSDLKKRVDEVLEIIGLTDRAGDRTEEYSGGMKRRLNIGLGLLHKPRLLLLDEPTVGVDPQSRNAILESVEHLSAEGMAVLYTTHYMEEAERLCDRVAILDHGKIVALDTPAALIRSLGAEERVVFSVDGSLPVGFEKALSGETHVEIQGRQISIRSKNGRKVSLVSEVVSLLGEQHVQFSDLRTEQPNLEDVFLSLTGREMRE
jgi:ABC-2 type transport system ATP-binding protein